MRYATLLTLASGLLQPPGILLAVAIFGWLLEILGWRHFGRILLLLALATLYFLSTAVGARMLVFPLENRYPPLLKPMHGPAAPQAIVVLGGGEIMDAPGKKGETVNARTLIRLLKAARLAGATGLPIVPSGGAPRLGAAPEAVTMGAVLRQDLHITTPIWPETHSYNTAANAFDSATLLAGHDVQRIYLVTSALHMPRAMAWFARTPLQVVPVPTDYRLDRVRDDTLDAWLPRAIYQEVSSEAVHEYLGLFWLWLQERSAGKGV